MVDALKRRVHHNDSCLPLKEIDVSLLERVCHTCVSALPRKYDYSSVRRWLTAQHRQLIKVPVQASGATPHIRLVARAVRPPHWVRLQSESNKTTEGRRARAGHPHVGHSKHQAQRRRTACVRFNCRLIQKTINSYSLDRGATHPTFKPAARETESPIFMYANVPINNSLTKRAALKLCSRASTYSSLSCYFQARMNQYRWFGETTT